MLIRMIFFKTTHERKSFLITILIVILLLFLFSLFDLKYMDPPIEYGMEVNFGSNDTGKGLSAVSEEITDSESEESDSLKEDSGSEKSTIPQASTSKVVTQKNSNSQMVEKNNKDSLISINNKIDSKLKQNIIEVKKPKVSDATKSIISNLINTESRSENIQGEGVADGLSNQGKFEGDPYSTIYYGQEGRGGLGIGYGLSGRSLQINGKETQDCNESGTVVVRIVVNKQGEVISAKPGVKGTTNNDACLLKPAQKTALMHRWFPDKNAPEKQIGFVVIEFKLVE